jgi:hypothetical protein
MEGEQLSPLWAGFVRVLIEASKRGKMTKEPPSSLLYPAARKPHRKG